MAQGHRLDCKAATAGRRFIVQSESEEEPVELAKTHMHDVHGKDYSDQELRSGHLIV